MDKHRISNIIVVDNPRRWKLDIESVEVVSSKDYTSNKGEYSERPLRVFNLCNSYKYQSLGYYVSLLASARQHRAIPNVTTIQDFKNISVVRSIAEDIDKLIQESFQAIKKERMVLNIYFGQTIDPTFRQLGQKLYQLFETPLLRIHFTWNERWDINRIEPLSLTKIDANDFETVKQFAASYFKLKRFQRSRLKKYTYYLAVLVNPNEQNPPSNKKALKKFEKAAEEMDFYMEFITKEDYNKLYEYDALFIRETTDVNNHTYQFARKAYAEGLVVIDDPWSILRCSNKIYLHERLKHNKIPTPQTTVFFKGLVRPQDLEKLTFPIILKQPDSAFSLGVTKVNNAAEMKEALEVLFKKSELVVGQEFIPSDFDWRIGVLDDQPLFACKYYMAKGHWQIYNWKAKRSEKEGNAETLPIHEVPQKVLKYALKAAALMGDGLYGVDLKVVGNKVYVIEVNDNPNIDVGVEDRIGGAEIYRKIMKSIQTRIEVSRNISRFVSIEPD